MYSYISQLAYQSGFSRQNMYFIITGLHSLTLVNTLAFLPKKFIPRPEPPKIQREVAESGEAAVELLNGEKLKGLDFFVNKNISDPGGMCSQ